MDAARPEPDRPAVAVFRSTAFNRSEAFIQTQAASLSRYRPLVVALKRTDEVSPELRDSVLTPWSPIEAARLRLTGRPPLPEALKQARPALVHAHFAPDGLLALPLARQLGVPLVTSLRGYDVSVYPARMLASGRLSWMRYAVAGGRLRREGELFLAVSDELRRLAVGRGFPEARILTHYDGVDLDRFRPQPGAAVPGLVLHVGRLVEKKGQALLLRAFAEARRAHPRAELVIIGEGPLEAALKALAGELGLGDVVRFLGARPHAVVRDWMARAWVFASPSIRARNGDAEGLPTVLVEAAASATPAIGSVHSGIPEIVVEGRSGLLFPEGDAMALAARLSELLAAPDLRNRLAAGARRLAQERFDARAQARALEAHYDRLIGRP
jgi:glycosyltransferase involved in cell wall biosynthesis